jgi:hypothetical protein
MLPRTTIPHGGEFRLPLHLVPEGAEMTDIPWPSQSPLNVRERLLASAAVSFLCVLLRAGEHLGSRPPISLRGRHPL